MVTMCEGAVNSASKKRQQSFDRAAQVHGELTQRAALHAVDLRAKEERA